VADDDIHTIWSIGSLIQKIGPSRAVREFKKRCEAGAIIGCSIYMGLCVKWLNVTMDSEEPALRGPAEEFLLAAGEDKYVNEIEEMFKKYPGGIPKSKRFDVIDQFELDLEKRVGRRIPRDPAEASKEDIKHSKMVAAALARGETGIIEHKPPQPEISTPAGIIPQPIPTQEVQQALKREQELDKRLEELRKKKELERKERESKTKPPSKPPEQPPQPEQPPKHSMELDLMKDEIERRIAEIKRRRAMGEGQAGEPAGGYTYKKKEPVTTRTALLQVTGTESRYSGSQYIKTPVSVSVEKDQYAHFLIYRKGKEKEVHTSYHAKTYGPVHAERYQSSFGYTVEIRLTDEKNSHIKVLFDPAPGKIINGLIFENDHKIAEFDVDEPSFRKAEQFARDNKVIKEAAGGYPKDSLVTKSYAELHFLINTCQDTDKLKKLYAKAESLIKLTEFDKELLKEEISQRIQDILEAEESTDKGRALSSEERLKKYKAWKYTDFENAYLQSYSLDEMNELMDAVYVLDTLSRSDKEKLRFRMRERIHALKPIDEGFAEGAVVYTEKKRLYKSHIINKEYSKLLDLTVYYIDLTQHARENFREEEYARAFIIENEKNRTIEIYSIYVPENYRKQGIAKELITEILKDADAKCMKVIVKPAGEINSQGYLKLKNYYTQFGFSIDRELSEEPNIIMMSREPKCSINPHKIRESESTYGIDDIKGIKKAALSGTKNIWVVCRGREGLILASKYGKEWWEKAGQDDIERVTVYESGGVYSKQTVEYRISKDTYKHFYTLLLKATEDGKEHGTTLCVNERGEITGMGDIIGTEREVIIRGNCPVGLRSQGEFHVHPHHKMLQSPGQIYNPGPSLGDLVKQLDDKYEGISEGTVCVMSDMDTEHIICYTVKNDAATMHNVTRARMAKVAGAENEPGPWLKDMFIMEVIDLKNHMDLVIAENARNIQMQGYARRLDENQELLIVETNLLNVGYDLRNDGRGHMVLPNGKGVSPTNNRGIVNHWEVIVDAGYLPISNISKLNYLPGNIIAGAINKGWRRWNGEAGYEVRDLCKNNIDFINKRLKRYYENDGLANANIDIWSEGKAYNFDKKVWDKSNHDILQVIKKVTPKSYHAAKAMDLKLMETDYQVREGSNIIAALKAMFKDIEDTMIFVNNPEYKGTALIENPETNPEPNPKNEFLIEENVSIGDPDAWIKSNGGAFQDDIRGAHHGQVDGTLVAYDTNTSKTIGYIDYSLFEKKIYLNSIEVAATHRRQGYATAMMLKLKQINPGIPIKWGMMTEEGCALKNAIDKESPDNPPGVKIYYESVLEEPEKYRPEHKSESAFLRYHNTGYIDSEAYHYNTIESLSWQRPEEHKIIVKTLTTTKGKIQLRKSDEKLKYVRHDAGGDMERDPKTGLALYMSDEEISAKKLPKTDTSIVAYNEKNQAVGFASNEWGADGVWVIDEYQRLGIGVNLLSELRAQFPPTRKIGQMTDAGYALAKAYYRRIKKENCEPNTVMERASMLSKLSKSDIIFQIAAYRKSGETKEELERMTREQLIQLWLKSPRDEGYIIGESFSQYSKEERMKLAKTIAGTIEKRIPEGVCISTEDLSKLTKQERTQLAKNMYECTAGDDCKEWDFGDFEIALAGMESKEDLEDLLDCVMASTVLTEPEIDTISKRITKKMEA
jgi:GNAT superfamily N-acetyltransferase